MGGCFVTKADQASRKPRKTKGKGKDAKVKKDIKCKSPKAGVAKNAKRKPQRGARRRRAVLKRSLSADLSAAADESASPTSKKPRKAASTSTAGDEASPKSTAKTPKKVSPKSAAKAPKKVSPKSKSKKASPKKAATTGKGRPCKSKARAKKASPSSSKPETEENMNAEPEQNLLADCEWEYDAELVARFMDFGGKFEADVDGGRAFSPALKKEIRAVLPKFTRTLYNIYWTRLTSSLKIKSGEKSSAKDYFTINASAADFPELDLSYTHRMLCGIQSVVEIVPRQVSVLCSV